MKALLQKFAALQAREKNMVALAAGAVILFLGYMLCIDPLLQKQSALAKENSAQQQELATVQAQVDALRLRTNDPDAANRVALAEAKKQLQDKEEALHQFDGALVPPEKMSRMLESLLARHRGLQLVSLKTLPAAPLNAQKEAKAADPKPTDGKPADAANDKEAVGQIYRHGIEIKLAGSYSDLSNYVSELQHAKQRPLWDGMELNVSRYPRSELTLTLYTLSLDRTWLLM